MKRISGIFLTLMFLSACSTQQPIQNVSASPVPLSVNGSMLTLEQVKKAVFAAAKIKGWTPTSVDGDTIQAEITVRQKHQATIDIDYSERSYSLTLKSSVGLDEKDGMIHRNYNKWITLLDQQIQIELLAETAR